MPQAVDVFDLIVVAVVVADASILVDCPEMIVPAIDWIRSVRPLHPPKTRKMTRKR